MKLLISRATHYGGIATFLKNFLENVGTLNDILILDPKIEKSLLEEIEELFQGKIMFFPDKYDKYNIIIKRLMHAIFIKKIISNNNTKMSLVFLEWNLVLDWLAHIGDYKILSFVHAYPSRNIPKTFKSLLNKLLKKTTIVTVSNYSSMLISEKWNINNNDIKVLYNFSNLDGKDEIVLRKDIDIVTIAHCVTYKNPELWYRIAKNVTTQKNNVNFHWYGDGELFEYYKNLTESDLNIHFHGYTKNISDILKNKTTIYLQCSNIESLGISILDAMNYSLPILVTEVGGMPELVKNGENGFVCHDSEGFSSKIIEISENNLLNKEMGYNSKKKYDCNFSKKIWMSQLKKILNEAIGYN